MDINLRNILIYVVTCLSISACNYYAALTDKQIEEKAIYITKHLDTSKLRLFHTWNYWQRGESSSWTKLSGDSSIYSWSFFANADTPTFSVSRSSIFLKDFTDSFSVDTLFYELQFTQVNDSSFKMMGSFIRDKPYAEDSVIANDLKIKNVFTKENPFEFFSELTKLKDSLGVIGIAYHQYPNGSNFIQFYFPTGQHILTYITDSTLNSPNLNKFWKQKFDEGKTISKDWNLRKLEYPIDGG